MSKPVLQPVREPGSKSGMPMPLMSPESKDAPSRASTKADTCGSPPSTSGSSRPKTVDGGSWECGKSPRRRPTGRRPGGAVLINEPRAGERNLAESARSRQADSGPDDSLSCLVVDLGRPRAIWDPKRWLRVRDELIKEGAIRRLPDVFNLARQVTDEAIQQRCYWSAGKDDSGQPRKVHLSDPDSQRIRPEVKWFGRSNASLHPILAEAVAAGSQEIAPPVLVCSEDPLEICAKLRQADGPNPTITCVVEVSEFDASGNIDLSARSPSQLQRELGIRSDFSKIREAKSLDVAGSGIGQISDQRSRLAARDDPYVCFFPNVCLFRGHREEGYPFLPDPVYVNAIVTSMSSKNPEVVMVWNPCQGRREEHYATEQNHLAVVERLNLIGLTALQEYSDRLEAEMAEDASPEHQPILVLSALGLGFDGKHPTTAVADMLRRFRKKFGRLFRSIFISCHKRPDIAAQLDLTINSQVYYAATFSSKPIRWHWDSKHLRIQDASQDLPSIGSKFHRTKASRFLNRSSIGDGDAEEAQMEDTIDRIARHCEDIQRKKGKGFARQKRTESESLQADLLAPRTVTLELEDDVESDATKSDAGSVESLEGGLLRQRTGRKLSNVWGDEMAEKMKNLTAAQSRNSSCVTSRVPTLNPEQLFDAAVPQESESKAKPPVLSSTWSRLLQDVKEKTKKKKDRSLFNSQIRASTVAEQKLPSLEVTRGARNIKERVRQAMSKANATSEKNVNQKGVSEACDNWVAPTVAGHKAVARAKTGHTGSVCAVKQVYMKCTQPILLTTQLRLKNTTTIRQVEHGEEFEVLSQDIEPKTEFPRAHVRSMRDLKEGWVTIQSNKATYLQECPRPHFCGKVQVVDRAPTHLDEDWFVSNPVEGSEGEADDEPGLGEEGRSDVDVYALASGVEAMLEGKWGLGSDSTGRRKRGKDLPPVRTARLSFGTPAALPLHPGRIDAVAASPCAAVPEAPEARKDAALGQMHTVVGGG